MSENLLDRVRRRFRLHSELRRCLLCEFICTALFMFTGLAINAQTWLSKKTMDDYTALSIGWGLSLTLSAQMGYMISGSHMNPAVSFFLWMFGKISKLQFLLYCIVQTAGAFLGSFLVFILYYDSIYTFGNGTLSVTGPAATAGIFATYPNEHLSFVGSIVDQILSTITLVMCICIICDERNKIPKIAQPTLLGFMLMLIQFSIAWNASNAMNPARDFGPRLMTFVVGYGWEVFSHRTYTWFWVPVICPFIGAFIGAWAYLLTIGVNISDEPEEPARSYAIPIFQRNHYPLQNIPSPIKIEGYSYQPYGGNNDVDRHARLTSYRSH